MHYDGLAITTHPDVYVPHDDTFLLAQVVQKQVTQGMRMLEVGCGTGLVSLVAARAGAKVVAVDANPLAVRLTQHNAKQNGIEVAVMSMDLLTGLAAAFDLIVFNPPYLPTAPEEKVQGPLNLAFDGGADGNETVLRFARQLASLDPRPTVMVVHSSLSDPSPLQAVMTQAGYSHEVVAREKLWFEELWVRRFQSGSIARRDDVA